MPFTFSHPAIVLPLAYFSKKWFSVTGLIVGSLTPDFEYFLRMKIKSDYSHTIDGLFWFELPLGIILAFIFHDIVRNNFFDNLPIFLKTKFFAFRRFDWNNYFQKHWLIVIISILIGATSHLPWDSFTHEHGFFVQTIPTLKSRITFFEQQIPVWEILQHSSSLIGGLVIVFTLYKLQTDKNVTANINSKYWITFFALSLIIIAIRFFFGLTFNQYGNLIVTGISACLISLILTSILTKKFKNNDFSPHFI